MKKSIVFISHITEEKEIAQSLKRLVESHFLNMIEVFVSSDPTSIKVGRRWLDEITYALKNCDVEIILASPESVRRPWINFEAGSGWVRDIAVIPVCHSGMIPPKLPAPLSFLQAATATDETQLKQIFPVLASAIGCALPAIDYAPFISVVKDYEATSRQIKELQARTPVAPTDGLSPLELATLVEIAERVISPGERVAIRVIRDGMEKSGHRGVAVSLALKMLSRKSFVETSLQSDSSSYDEYHGVFVTDEGWHWLEANQDKLELKIDPGTETPASSEAESDDIPF